MAVLDRRNVYHGPPIGSRLPGVKWSRDRWRHVTPKSKGRDSIIFEAPYLRNCARKSHALRYNATNGNIASLTITGNFFVSVSKIGHFLWTLGRQLPITILTPVTISIILNGSQLDAGSLIQAERNEKTLRGIQKKMMRARSTLDWSQ